MTVYLDKARKIWLYDFWLAGRRHKAQCRHEDGSLVTSRRQALAIQEKVRVNLRSAAARAVQLDVSNYTLAEAIAARGEEAKRLKNFHDIRGMLSEILDFFGPETPLAHVATRWREFRAHCSEQPVRKWRGGPKQSGQKLASKGSLWSQQNRVRSPARVNRYLDQFSAILRLASATETPSGVPLLAKLPKIQKLKEPIRDPNPVPLSILAKIEADRDLPIHLRQAAALARLFGLRMTEVFEARVEWIDLENQALRVPATFTKAGRDETLPANAEAMALLRSLAVEAKRRNHAKNFLITYTPSGRDRRGLPFPPRPIRNARRAWSTALKKHGGGQNWRFHDLRATYVTQIAQVASAATTQSLARHKSPITTSKYTKIADQARRAAVDAMASPHDLVDNKMIKRQPPSARPRPHWVVAAKNARKVNSAP